MGGTIDPEQFWKPASPRAATAKASIVLGALDIFIRDSIKAQTDRAMVSATEMMSMQLYASPPRAPFGSKMSGWGVPIEGEAFKGLSAWIPKASDNPVNLYGVDRAPRLPRPTLAFSGKIDLRLGLRGK